MVVPDQMAFSLHNSEQKKKVDFQPLHAGKIDLYVCGMTVYDYCHIGHARIMVCFDFIVRFLRYQGWQVNYVRNITDIDDKIIKRAAENNESIHALTARFIDAMNQDSALLGCLPPDQEPKATEHIQSMQNMIQTLINNGYAYAVADGDVYYAVDQFAEYGRLSGRNLTDLQAGASERVDTDQAKKNPFDFVLWKAAKANEPAWPSPWGQGRPGWHIECSAMSTCCLGNHFDIHGGGGDLLFPHHENEVAQSEAATGESYVNYWMHVGFVNIDGEKMSKSLSNSFLIRDATANLTPEALRYFIVASHYRSPLNYSEQALKEAEHIVHRFYSTLQAVDAVLAQSVSEPSFAEQKADYIQRFNQAMADDFNTPLAMVVLFEIQKRINRQLHVEQFSNIAELQRLLLDLSAVLGLFQQAPEAVLSQSTAEGELSAESIEQQIVARQTAKSNKDFAQADQIRQDLLAQGVVLEDGRNGTTWRRQN